MEGSPFIRKAQSETDPGSVSRVIVAAVQVVYSKTVRRIAPAGLEARTDEDGNLQPYAADDPEVLGRMFGVSDDDWERVT